MSCPWPAMLRTDLLKVYKTMKNDGSIDVISNVASLTNEELASILCDSTVEPPFLVRRLQRYQSRRTKTPLPRHDAARVPSPTYSMSHFTWQLYANARWIDFIPSVQQLLESAFVQGRNVITRDRFVFNIEESTCLNTFTREISKIRRASEQHRHYFFQSIKLPNLSSITPEPQPSAYKSF
jgi:hypothetical protein